VSDGGVAERSALGVTTTDVTVGAGATAPQASLRSSMRLPKGSST
jgi:hypothetical protein